jgi:hypothetical protein
MNPIWLVPFLIGPLVLADTGEQSAAEDLKQLNKIASRLIVAVKSKNQSVILELYPVRDRPGIAEPGSELYCYLFDSTCISWKSKSVKQIFTDAKRLRTKIVLPSFGPDGTKFALLFFFDRAVVDPHKLDDDPDYACSMAGKYLVSYLFKYENSKWVPANLPFDAETDTLCRPEESKIGTAGWRVHTNLSIVPIPSE